MKRVAVLTSGGDAPGMNAAIRAVVRTGVLQGLTMFGVRHGYAGLLRGELVPLGARDVGGIIHLGGTMLGTSRCEAFKTEQGQRGAIDQLRNHDIAALIIIGGNGSQTGAHALSQLGMPVVGVASTIDNDLLGTDISIGATTALDIALESMDRLRVTARAHERAFLVEVMGRHCGYLAAAAAIAGGAEAVVVPEATDSPEAVASQLRASRDRGKSHAIVIVAEGAHNNAEAIAAYFAQHSERLVVEVLALGRDPATVKVNEVMTKNPVIASASEDTSTALERMRAQGVRRVPVVDDGGFVLGIITLDDLLSAHAEEGAAIAQVVGNAHRRESRTRR